MSFNKGNSGGHSRRRCPPPSLLLVPRWGSSVWLFAVLIILAGLVDTNRCEAQTAGKYEFYRYPQHYAIQIDPLGQILGRLSGQFEQRLDPNFTRAYEIVYQKKLEDEKITGWFPMSGITLGVFERIYLIDNAAMLGQYAGVGGGVGMVSKTISLRLSAEMGYKYAFGFWGGHYFIEPRIVLDAYLFTNPHAKHIVPVIAIPFGYAFW